MRATLLAGAVALYEWVSMFTHGSLDLVEDCRGAFSTVPVGNQNAEYLLASPRARARVRVSWPPLRGVIDPERRLMSNGTYGT